jgi:hypothetical protein
VYGEHGAVFILGFFMGLTTTLSCYSRLRETVLCRLLRAA